MSQFMRDCLSKNWRIYKWYKVGILTTSKPNLELISFVQWIKSIAVKFAEEVIDYVVISLQFREMSRKVSREWEREVEQEWLQNTALKNFLLNSSKIHNHSNSSLSIPLIHSVMRTIGYIERRTKTFKVSQEQFYKASLGLSF